MTRQNHKRGFSLIEAAIVLGVVGLVIGGIWIGAAAVRENHKLNQTVSGILTIVKNTRRIFYHNWPSGNVNLAYASGQVPPVGFSIGIFNGAAGFSYIGSNVIDPFGYNNLSIVYYSNAYGLSNILVVWFHNPISVERCIKLASAISSKFRDTNDLMRVHLPGSGGGFISSFPLIPTNTQCTPGANPVGFIFST